MENIAKTIQDLQQEDFLSELTPEEIREIEGGIQNFDRLSYSFLDRPIYILPNGVPAINVSKYLGY